MNERTVFITALEKEDFARRKAYLDDVCAGDSALRDRVEALLRSHEREGKFLDVPAAEQLSPGITQEQMSTAPDAGHGLEFLAPADMPGSIGRLGHYDIQEVVGRGGMGIVLKALDLTLQRVVAIKVLAPALATSATAQRRFVREARAAAAVRNDHVIDIYSVQGDHQPPYLVMEYIAGESLQKRLDRTGPLQLKEILRIGQQTASGLAAAHAQGLIHRDVKPANILLENGVERVKLTDFGLARAVDDASVTQSSVVAGTPQYMAPEQASGEAVDHRADLFSLGSVLYALCTGRAPFRASTSMAVLKRVCEETPTPIRESNPDIPDWLIAIIDKLHAKEKADRLQSAAEAADLLGQHLAHLQQPSVVPMPLLPSPLGGEGTGVRVVRRRWAVAAAVVLCFAGGLSLTEATGVTDLRATVIRILTPNGTLVVETDDPSVKVTIEGDGGIVITGAGPQEVRLKPGSYKVQATKDGKPARVDRELITITRNGKQSVKVSLESDVATAATGPKVALASGKVRIFVGNTGSVYGVAFSPDGRHALSVGSDRLVRLWDVEMAKELRRFEGHTDVVFSAVFSPDGRYILTGGGVWTGGGDHTVRLWEAATGKELHQFKGHTKAVYGVAFSPDGRRALSGSYDGTIRLWDVQSAKELRRFEGAPNIRSVVVSADGHFVLSGGNDGTVRLWDVETGEEVKILRGHTGRVESVAFSPDGRQALSGSTDHSVRLWDLEAGKEVRRFEGHTDQVYSVAFLPDGQHAVSCCNGGTIRLWNVESGQELFRLDQSRGLNCVAVSPDGRRILFGGSDKIMRLWELIQTPSPTKLASGEVRRFVGHTNGINYLAISKDGRRVLSAARDKTLRLWDVATGKEIRRFLGHTFNVSVVALSPDDRRAVSISHYNDPTVRYWDMETGKELPFWKLPAAWGVAFSPDGRRLLSSDHDHNLRLWEVATGKELRRFQGHAAPVVSLAFSPDGRRILSGSWDKSVRLWDAETGKELRHFKGHTEAVFSVAWSPDSRRALSGGGDLMRIWDVESGTELPRFKHREEWVESVSFSPDGRYALSGGGGGVCLWHIETGELLARLRGHTNYVSSVGFTPDGRHALSAGWDGDNTLCLWELPIPQKTESDQQGLKAEPNAFVLLGSKGAEIRKFDTLIEAVQHASDGDTIEIRCNGPFISKQIKIEVRGLTIRAGSGYRPVIRIPPELPEYDLISVGGPGRLVLEGLEIRGIFKEVPAPKEYSMIFAPEKSLHLTNCRLAIEEPLKARGAYVLLANPIVLRNCELYPSSIAIASFDNSRPVRIAIENCVSVGSGGVVSLHHNHAANDVLVRLRYNTLVCPGATGIFFAVAPSPPTPRTGVAKPTRIRFDSLSNVFGVRNSMLSVSALQSLKTKWEKAEDAEAFIKPWIHWQEQGSLYSAGAARIVAISEKGAAFTPGPGNLNDWERRWNVSNTGSLEGPVRFQGGDLLARAATASEKITSDDFRLRPDSAGYRAGKDGKALGADVDLIGPGPAYERWKKSPEYQQWLKETGQVK